MNKLKHPVGAVRVASRTLHFRTVALAAATLLSACSETEPVVEEDTLTPQQQSVYEECLEQSQAVAEAWENIQARCRKEALGIAPQLPE